MNVRSSIWTINLMVLVCILLQLCSPEICVFITFYYGKCHINNFYCREKRLTLAVPLSDYLTAWTIRDKLKGWIYQEGKLPPSMTLHFHCYLLLLLSTSLPVVFFSVSFTLIRVQQPDLWNPCHIYCTCPHSFHLPAYKCCYLPLLLSFYLPTYLPSMSY